MSQWSAAERMRAYRARMSSEKRSIVREQNRMQQHESRTKWTATRQKDENESSRVRMRKMRNILKENRRPSSTVSPLKVFSSAQALGKALSRAKRVLPKSPRKKIALVRKLATDFGLEGKTKTTTNHPTELESEIKKFYHNDLVSRQLPGMKDYVSVRTGDGKKEKLQKRILLYTVFEAYQLFKTENPDKKIGKSKFASLRPQNVVPVSDRDHNVCCCRYHENFDLLLDGLRKKYQNTESSNIIISQAACDWCMACYFGECDACCNLKSLVDKIIPACQADNEGNTINYYQWNTQNQKILVHSSISATRDELTSQLSFMKRHSFLAKVQLRQIRSLKQNIVETEAILQEDFSENFAVKQQNEIMSAHWITEYVTLFTAILNQSNEESLPYVIVSDALSHDKYSVFSFNQAILRSYFSESDSRVATLHVFSDGAASQFKNRYTLSTILSPGKIHKNITNMDWSFFATAHGKGPVDGIGGTVKRAVWRRILQNRAVVNNAIDFAQVAKESCPNIKIIFISKEEVKNCKDILEDSWQQNPPAAIHQLHQMHFVRANNTSTLEVGRISPFIHSLPVELHKAVIFPTANLLHAISENNADSAIVAEPIKECNPKVVLTATIGDYVVVQYEGNTYPGLVEDVRNSEYLVNTLHRCGGAWRWPTVKDAIWYQSLIRKLKAPTPANSRGMFAFEDFILV